MRQDSEGEKTGIVIDAYESGHIDPPFSHAFVWPLVFIWIASQVLSLRGRKSQEKLALDADRAVDASNTELWLGQRYIAGVVEYAEGERSAVEVQITQRGTESKGKHGWRHQWTESGRTTEARPFYVRRNDKERIRVEPGASVLLVDDPDGMIWREKTLRTRIARLAPGERVVVEGSLARGHDPEQREKAGYRGTEAAWIMRPLRNGHMHISAEPLGDRHRQRAALFKNSSTFIAIIGLFLHALFFTYYVRLGLGETVVATVINKDHFVSKDSKGRRTDYYRVFLNLNPVQRGPLSRDLAFASWRILEKGYPIYYRDVPSMRAASSPGKGVSIYGLPLVFGALLSLVAAAIYAGTVAHKMWYEGRLDDAGSGKLPERPRPGS